MNSLLSFSVLLSSLSADQNVSNKTAVLDSTICTVGMTAFVLVLHKTSAGSVGCHC